MHDNRDVACCVHIELKVTQLAGGSGAECSIEAIDVIAGVVEQKVGEACEADDIVDAI